MTSKKQEVILYARVSTEEQASDDHFSIDAQFNEMRAYAEAQGWIVKSEFVDGGVTGTRLDRPQLEAAMAMVEAEECDVLLVHELSRLSRSSIYETFNILETIGKHGAGFASVKERQFNFADPSSRLFLTILTAMNQYYIDQLRMHTSKAKKERARQGLYNSSIAPYGYQHTGGPKDPPIIDKDEVDAVRMIFNQYATGRHTFQDVADIVNDAGYSPRKRKRFSKDTLTQMVKNRFYMGQVVYGARSDTETKIYDGQHEAIVSKELWMRCKQVRDRHSSGSRAVQKPYRVYLLSQLAYCDVCHRALRSQASKAGSYYREASYQRGYQDCPNQRIGTRTEPVDAYIDGIVQNIGLPDDWLEEIREQISEDEEIDSLRRKRERLEAQRKRAKRLYIRGEFEEDLEIYKQAIARISRDLDSIPTYDQLEGLKSTIVAVQDLYETWDEAAPVDQRDLMRLMFRKAWVDVPGQRVVALKPQAFLFPILRQVEMLEEREMGYFVPRWSPDQAEDVLTFTKLEPLIKAPERGDVLPYIVSSPLRPASNRRTTSGISDAMKIKRETGIEPETICQVITPTRAELPVGLRRWPDAAYETLEPDEINRLEEETVDVLVTQFLLGDQIIMDHTASLTEILHNVYKSLSPGGVWYMIETSPQDMPAHWLYRYFAPAWEWEKMHSWNLYDLYNQLLKQ
ncbi:MAG: recombinase family protein, partial [Chloroflexota bacterium]|nr:recombinase family protein [Chloroflexota bacterium]